MAAVQRTTSDRIHLRVITDADVRGAARNKRKIRRRKAKPRKSPLPRCPACELEACEHWPDGVPVLLRSVYPAAPDPMPALLPAPIEAAYDQIVPPPASVAELADGPREVIWGGLIRKRRHGERQEMLLKKPIGETRPHSLGTGRLSPLALRKLEKLEAELRAEGVYDERPKHGNGVDGDCQPGPCPWVRCTKHLYMEVNPENGAIKLNFPGRDVDEIGETCSLREALRGAPPGERQGSGNSVPRVAKSLNLVPESIRQILKGAVKKYKVGMGVNDVGTDEVDEFEDNETTADAGDSDDVYGDDGTE